MKLVKELPRVRAAKAPTPPTMFKTLRVPVYRLVLSSQFANAMLAAVIFNVSLLACDYHRIDEDRPFYDIWLAAAEFFFYFYW